MRLIEKKYNVSKLLIVISKSLNKVKKKFRQLSDMTEWMKIENGTAKRAKSNCELFHQLSRLLELSHTYHGMKAHTPTHVLFV